jgi:hypothetical protein
MNEMEQMETKSMITSSHEEFLAVVQTMIDRAGRIASDDWVKDGRRSYRRYWKNRLGDLVVAHRVNHPGGATLLCARVHVSYHRYRKEKATRAWALMWVGYGAREVNLGFVEWVKRERTRKKS